MRTRHPSLGATWQNTASLKTTCLIYGQHGQHSHVKNNDKTAKNQASILAKKVTLFRAFKRIYRSFGIVIFQHSAYCRQHCYVENNIGQYRTTCHVENNIAKIGATSGNMPTLKTICGKIWQDFTFNRGENIMAKPRNILMKQETKGMRKTYYGCPWCFRFVARKRGLQQCAKCGGMVDNDHADPWPPKTRMKFDGRESWR